ncbi:MAG: energy transducer TonB [Bacteroidales bacterium]|nr:energy transducer TonB [Bacteroidales bacterium]
MVRRIIFALSVFYTLFSIPALCQIDSTYIDDIELILIVESFPEYKGGTEAFSKMIKTNLIYPQSALMDSIEGRVYVQFWVETNGNTINHIVVRGIRKDLDEEALRVARLIKFDKPAMQRGKPIKVRYNLPIVFKLPMKSEPKKKGCRK